MKFFINITFIIIFISIFQELLYGQEFWEQTNGPFGEDIKSLVINSDGHIFAGTNKNGIYFSTDNGDSWAQTDSGLTNKTIHNLETNSLNHIFAGTGTGVFRSIDNGDSWEQKGLTSRRNIYSIDFNPAGHIYAGGSGSYVYRSTTNGDNWIEKYLGSIYYGSVYAIAINSSWHIFVGTNYYLFKSTNNGDSWERLSTTWNNTKDIEINSLGHIFVASDSGIFKSMDNGEAWNRTNNGLLNLDVRCLVIDKSDHIFAGTYGGEVYRSTDNGENWQPINSGLINPFVLALAISPSGHLFAGTWGNGVFKSVQSITSVDRYSDMMPQLYELKQNYPNPFNPETIIQYYLPRESKVRLYVYNILGKLIKILVEEEQPAGHYSVHWNAKDKKAHHVAAGLYFYSIRANDFVQTRTMILTK